MRSAVRLWLPNGDGFYVSPLKRYFKECQMRIVIQIAPYVALGVAACQLCAG